MDDQLKLCRECFLILRIKNKQIIENTSVISFELNSVLGKYEMDLANKLDNLPKAKFVLNLYKDADRLFEVRIDTCTPQNIVFESDMLLTPYEDNFIRYAKYVPILAAHCEAIRANDYPLISDF